MLDNQCKDYVRVREGLWVNRVIVYAPFAQRTAKLVPHMFLRFYQRLRCSSCRQAHRHALNKSKVRRADVCIYGGPKPASVVLRALMGLGFCCVGRRQDLWGPSDNVT